MSVESATYIADLVPTNPPSTDNVSQGDDVLRLIKTVLQATFPGATAVWTDLVHTWAAAQTFSLATSLAVPVELISTNADANAGPIASWYRNSASPLAADIIGAAYFYGKDSAGNKDAYAMIRAVIDDPTSTTEDGHLEFGVMTAGSFAQELALNGAALFPFTSGGLDLGAAALRWATAHLTTIELGHATDTTIARLSAGDLSVEGNRLYRAGGADIPVTDGGTGSSTGSTAVKTLADDLTAFGGLAQGINPSGDKLIFKDNTDGQYYLITISDFFQYTGVSLTEVAIGTGDLVIGYDASAGGMRLLRYP